MVLFNLPRLLQEGSGLWSISPPWSTWDSDGWSSTYPHEIAKRLLCGYKETKICWPWEISLENVVLRINPGLQALCILNKKFREFRYFITWPGYVNNFVESWSDFIFPPFPPPSSLVQIYYTQNRCSRWSDYRPQYLHADKIFRIHCRDGKDKDILFTAVFFPNGKELVTIDEITERKRSEETIRESEIRLNPL